MCELKKDIVPRTGEEEFSSFFADYNSLGIKPTHVFRKASEHKNAAQVLERCIANLQNAETIKEYHKRIEQILTPEEYLASNA